MSDVHVRLQVTKDRDEFEKERDAYTRQFDELSKIRETDAEKSFRSYRDKAESRAESQSTSTSPGPVTAHCSTGTDQDSH